MVGIIVTIFIILLIAAVVQAFRAKIWVSKTFGYNYVITMANGKKLPDLTQNTKLKNNVRVVGETEHSCSVQSKINDTELKTLLMKEYHLDSTDIHVQTAQLSGVLGMVQKESGVMNWIILAFVIIIAGVWLFSSRYQKEYYAQGEQMGGPYLIQFKDVDILPDLLANRELRETIDVIHADSNGKNYRVYSKINDKKLQQLIVKEFGLTTNQVQVTYTKLYTFV